jgi:hypothetical protein
MVFAAIERLPKDLWPVSVTMVTMHLWEKCAYKTRIFWRNWGKQRQNKPWEQRLDFSRVNFYKRTGVICLLNRDQTGSGSDRAYYPTGIGMRSSFFWDVTQRRLVVSYRRFGTTYWPISNGQAVLKIRPRCCPETSAANYQSTLRNIPEERRSHLYGGERSLSPGIKRPGRETHYLRPTSDY